jgi:rhodanese-related sulfurtransferase
MCRAVINPLKLRKRITMKNLKLVIAFITLALATTLAFAADAPASKPAADAHPYKGKLVPKLDRAQLDKLLGHPEKILFIDLRRPDELTAIGGFPIYLSIQAKNLAESLDYIPKGRKIITVSNHAGRAGAAADLLKSKGFNVIGAVGAQDYEAEGGSLSKIAPPKKKPEVAGAASGVSAASPAPAVAAVIPAQAAPVAAAK